MSRGRILVVDDDESLRRVMQVQLEDLGYDVATAADGDSRSTIVAVVHPGTGDLRSEDARYVRHRIAQEGARRLSGDHRHRGHRLWDGRVGGGGHEAGGLRLHHEARASPMRWSYAWERRFSTFDLLEEVRILRSTLDQKYGFENILGRSDALLYVLDQTARAAQTDATVLIHGETGTGKELLAKAIHFNSAVRTAHS